MSKSDTEEELWLFRSYAGQDEIDAVTEVIERGTWWAKGDEIDRFENRIADLTDREHAVALNSGTSALYAALIANGITDGEVVVPSYTFVATANAVVAAGATPVFADIEPDSLALSADAVRDLVGPDTRAIMPIHFGGDVAADIRELRAIADDKDCLLIEDACHSPGATLDGQSVGSFGDAAAFSFCFNKVITTGEGGMVVTDSTETKHALERIRSHGADPDGSYVTYGYNLRMPTMCAALGVAQMDKFDFIVSRRREMATHLNDRLRDVDGLHVPEFPPERDSVYQLYNLRFEDPDVQSDLASYLDERGIPSRVTYDPVHLTPYYRTEWGYGRGDLPVTEHVSNRILTLPFHLYLTESDLNRIAGRVREFFRNR